MKKKEYDYLLVGAGLFNAIFAYEASKDGKKCLVIEKRPHVGGNLYCEKVEDIIVHKYGPHIFHTQHNHIWEYIKQLCNFDNFVYRPIAFYKDKLYNLPFNMHTFYQLWGTRWPKDAIDIIDSQRLKIDNPRNFEEQALSLVGVDVYNKLIKGYTEKQWGMNAKKLPAFIIKRIPLRFTFDNNYFNDPYQGIPSESYNVIFDKCFRESDVLLNTDFLYNRDIGIRAKKIIYTGTIDQYYNYCYGKLGYRSLKFESELLNTSNYQGNATVNYTDADIPYTRIIEHKHFKFDDRNSKTIITREYPLKWSCSEEPYYPINTDKNNELYRRYLKKSKLEANILFAGRLGGFSYYDMDQTICKALSLYKQIK